MNECFWDSSHLNKANKQRLEQVNQIIERYAAQGYRLTLRQLYYQLVSQALIPNKVQEYAKLSKLLVNGRMAGEVDWESIEDRIRVPHIPYWATGVIGTLKDTIDRYRLDRMEGQDNYIEVHCEKDALTNILYQVTYKYHIRLMINRGYSSCTAMYDAHERLDAHSDLECYILYLGDHDPSGLDMIRDTKERLKEFGIEDLHVEHVAITREQIDEYNPPPNPAKIDDPRSRGDKGYLAIHGDTCWEVDALNPETLHELLVRRIEELINLDKYEAVLEQEDEDKDKLREFVDQYIEEE